MKGGVFFDLGRVLLDFDLHPFFAEIANQTAVDMEQVRSSLVGEQWFNRYERGEFGDEEFFEGVYRITGYDGNRSLLRQLWIDIFTPIEKNIALLHRLRERYPVGLISNTSPLHIVHVEERYDLLSRIAVVVLSYQVGVMKPDRRIFEIALSRLDVDAASSVFIDDLLGNFDGARELGMQVIHYTPDIDLERSLADLGFS